MLSIGESFQLQRGRPVGPVVFGPNFLKMGIFAAPKLHFRVRTTILRREKNISDIFPTPKN